MKYRKALLIIMVILGIWLIREHPIKFRSALMPVHKSTDKSELSSKGLLSNPRIFRVHTGSQKLVALTFDDGPDARFTLQALDILQQYDIKATFFVVGETAAAHPELVKRLADQGHEIENHTYTHPDLTQLSAVQTQEEIIRAGEVIEGVTGKKLHYFRPPKGLSTDQTLDIAAANGYQVILWSIGLEHDSCRTINDMAQRVIDKAEPGIIILAHDGRLDRSRTMQALPLVIEGYQKQGYRFVVLKELMDSQIEYNNSAARVEFITGLLEGA